VINSSGHIFAGTYLGGIFRSTDNGDSWAPLNTALADTFVMSLIINSTGHIFAGTARGGVFQSVQSTTAIQEPAGELPSSFDLAQNYPNPFNPSTTIVFLLPRFGHVTLKVFNAFGEEIATLMDKKLNAGRHRVSWAAEKLASGIYFYRMQVNYGEWTNTKKMIFVR
jgi:Secretion system C-terminal sorting domain